MGKKGVVTRARVTRVTSASLKASQKFQIQFWEGEEGKRED